MRLGQIVAYHEEANTMFAHGFINEVDFRVWVVEDCVWVWVWGVGVWVGVGVGVWGVGVWVWVGCVWDCPRAVLFVPWIEATGGGGLLGPMIVVNRICCRGQVLFQGVVVHCCDGLPSLPLS